MAASHFMLGLCVEETGSALGQVELWDGLTIEGKLRRTLAARLRRGRYARALEAYLQPQPWVSEFTGTRDPQAMKLSRLCWHLRIPVAAVVDSGQLHAVGLKIEQAAIATTRGLKLHREFPIESIDDVVRVQVLRLFGDLEARVAHAPPIERERALQEVAEALDRMDTATREKIMQQAKLDDFTAQTLLRSGVLSSLGIGLASLVGTAGFTAYTTLNAAIAGLGSLAGLTLPFSVYITATSLLAFLSNPLVVVAVTSGGAACLANRANKKLRGELFPLLVALACAKSGSSVGARLQVRELAQHLNARYQEFLHGEADRRTRLQRAFPTFGAAHAS